MQAFKIFSKALMMGASDIIPGVSGGTIALILGIYERLIKALASANLYFVTDYIRYLWTKDKVYKKSAKKNLMRMDPLFLLPLGMGILTAIIAGSYIIPYLMQEYPAYTYSFFAGLILASAVFIYRRSRKKSIKLFLISALGTITGLIIVSMNELHMNHDGPIIFISGVFAISAMLLPGISGSFVLLMLGQYSYILELLHNIREGFPKLMLFGAGALVGFFGFSRVISYLFRKAHDETLFFLVGLMLGSFKLLIEKILPGNAGEGFSTVAVAIASLSFMCGIILVAVVNSRESRYGKV